MKSIAVLAVACALLVAAAVPMAQSRTRVVMLGTGTPNADPDRSGPSVAVVVDDTSYLVDFGAGVVRRAAAAERSGIKALAPENLTLAFATHLHSDHTLGLADLIVTPWILERATPLTLYGPRGLRAMTGHLTAAYAEDLRIRTHGGEPKHQYDPTRVIVHEITPGVVYRDDRVTVTAFAVPHGAWPQAFGYRFQTPDRTIVISGDTGPQSHIEDQCRRCDVLDPRGLLRRRVREAAAGVAGLPRALPHLGARARRDRRARATRTAGAVSPVDLELDGRGAAERSAVGLRWQGRLGARPRYLLAGFGVPGAGFRVLFGVRGSGFEVRGSRFGSNPP